MNIVAELIAKFAGPALCMPFAKSTFSSSDKRWLSILSTLEARNGFYAFESALHVLPLGDSCEAMELLEWNLPSTWKCFYQREHLENVTCFASDIFGDQFCLYAEGFGKLDAETGRIEAISESFEGWAKAILSQPDYHLGYALAHDWQKRNGPIKSGYRLIPKLFFVCGGEFSVNNLYEVDALTAMRLRGDLATQLHDTPDGSIIRFSVTEGEL